MVLLVAAGVAEYAIPLRTPARLLGIILSLALVVIFVARTAQRVRLAWRARQVIWTRVFELILTAAAIATFGSKAFVGLKVLTEPDLAPALDVVVRQYSALIASAPAEHQRAPPRMKSSRHPVGYTRAG